MRGSTVEERLEFAETCMKSVPKVEVAFLDQCLGVEGMDGTKVAEELRNKGFDGVICLLTASEEKSLLTDRRIDMLIRKGTPPTKVAIMVAHELGRRRGVSASENRVLSLEASLSLLCKHVSI